METGVVLAPGPGGADSRGADGVAFQQSPVKLHHVQREPVGVVHRVSVTSTGKPTTHPLEKSLTGGWERLCASTGKLNQEREEETQSWSFHYSKSVLL